jgi:hypothetical protein
VSINKCRLGNVMLINRWELGNIRYFERDIKQLHVSYLGMNMKLKQEESKTDFTREMIKLLDTLPNNVRYLTKLKI